MHTCECCGVGVSVGVAAIPFIPMSIAWCQACLDADVIPVWAAVANTAMCGGWEHCNDAWRKLVERTLTHFKTPREEFDAGVAGALARMTDPPSDSPSSCEGPPTS